MMIIKLGGGLIAPKNLPQETADIEKIKEIVSQVKGLWQTGQKLVLINGSGNFGHSWAKKYDTHKGFESGDEIKKWGAARTQYSAGLINKIVVGELLDAQLPAISVAPHDLQDFGKVGEFLELGLIPVLYGDVIWNKDLGCEIYSGEKIIQKLVEAGLKSKVVVQLSIEKGVWDEKKEIIPEINSENWEKYKQAITGSFGVDVTGGMLHKVEVSLEIAKKFNIPTYIADDLDNYEKGTKIVV